MKLLALDIDDTTIRHNGTLSEKNAAAIQSCTNRGIHVVIVTGRSPKGAYPIWEKLPCDEICVTLGGAVIKNMRTGEILDTTCMDPYVLRSALRHAKYLGLISQIYRGDDVFTEYENIWSDKYTEYLKLPQYKLIPDMQNLLHEGITKLLCFSPTDMLMENIASFSDLLGDKIGIAASSKNLIEINSPDADKGTGLMHLCKLLGIDIKDTVAMGDSLLDIPMLRAAGVGIAVKNSQNDVLAIADVIGPDCDDDAVAWAVERYFK